MFSGSDVVLAIKHGWARTWKFASSRSFIKTLEIVIPLVSTIIAGISAYASYLAADAARDQAQSSREGLNAGQRNELFLNYWENVSAFCIALDISRDADSHNSAYDQNGGLSVEFPMSQLHGVTSQDVDAHIKLVYKSFRTVSSSVQKLYGWLDDQANQQVYQQVKMLEDLESSTDLMNNNHSILVRSWVEQSRCFAIQSAILAWYRAGATGDTPAVNSIDQIKVRLNDLGKFPTVAAALDSLALSNGIDGMSTIEISALENPHASR